ncbi:MAG: hypothetical protein ACTILG_04165 [Sphingobacterium sp.]
MTYHAILVEMSLSEVYAVQIDRVVPELTTARYRSINRAEIATQKDLELGVRQTVDLPVQLPEIAVTARALVVMPRQTADQQQTNRVVDQDPQQRDKMQDLQR